MDVSVDGVFATTWTSSGLTTDFESVDLSGNSGQLVEVTGVLADSEEWLSIIEVSLGEFFCVQKLLSAPLLGAAVLRFFFFPGSNAARTA